ncbi:MAG TPA: TetR/AcrR family transcriptional regulator [Verrucomicrobiae bacterium]|jgi:AcrR family transcriptional regulator|nr:TetR/AcrR family transcriptional regulator [Verrucomicrobiae bacterium]
MKSRSVTSRHQERSEATRARLIRAAEKIFARDGFEAAKLEEIAAEAGHTRGAFYANFESKEDLFLALLEGEISSRINTVERMTRDLTDPREKLHAFREFFLTICQDRRWSLLALEFKLFAVRHPEVKARLTAMNRRLVGPRIGLLQAIMEGSGRKLPISPQAVAMSLSAVTNALSLEHMLDRSLMPETALKEILANYFDSLTAGHENDEAVKRDWQVPAKKIQRRTLLT